MSQKRRHSAAEAVMNVLIGLSISVAANALIFPLFGFHPNPRQNISISLIYTAISLVRSYLLRRLFNRWHTKAAR